MKLFQIDAFTDRIFHGNPAAVCPLDEWLPEAMMQNIAAENNLAETAFFVRNGQGYQLRWFTPAVEVDLCGHATLAAAHVLFEHLDYPGPQISFQTRSGELTVRRHPVGYTMDFPADQLVPAAPPEALVEGLGFYPKECYTGRDDYMVVVDNQEKVEQLQPDFRHLAKLEKRGVIITAPGREADIDFVSRCFFSPAGIDEDPVTGSAHTTMTPYWSVRLGKIELTARQISKRGGTVYCRFLGTRVELSGAAKTYLVGELV